MSVAKSVLSSRIAKLERQLNVKLLHRSPRGVTLTDAGQRFYDRMRDVISRLQEAVDEAADGAEADFQAKLRITAPMTFGTVHLGPKLFAFMRNHPGLDVTLEPERSLRRHSRGGFDLGVRIGRMQDSALMARRIAESRRVLCCSPEYASSHDLPRSAEEIAEHDCICYGNSSTAPYWQFQARQGGGEAQQVVVRGRTHLNNGASMRDAAIAGLGLAAPPLFIAASALQDGRLIEVMSEMPRYPMPFTLCIRRPATSVVLSAR
jgi:DNA-binding transcriptional LysR family regulator